MKNRITLNTVAQNEDGVFAPLGRVNIIPDNIVTVAEGIEHDVRIVRYEDAGGLSIFFVTDTYDDIVKNFTPA